jgi:hypothetical protein
MKNAVIHHQKSSHLTSNPTNYYYYLLCIQLSSPITFNDQAQPVALPEQLEPTKGGTLATVIGWGYPYVSTLLWTPVLSRRVIKPQAICNTALNGKIQIQEIIISSVILCGCGTT